MWGQRSERGVGGGRGGGKDKIREGAGVKGCGGGGVGIVF